MVISLKIYNYGISPDDMFKWTACTIVMDQLAARLSNLLQSFRDHVMEHNTEGLVPKLMSNVQLSSECVEPARKEVVEKEDFLKFYEHLATGNEFGNGECHYSRVSLAREKLSKHNVQFKEAPFTCDCGISFDLPLPLSQAFQEIEVSLTRLLLTCDLDHVCQLATSRSSLDQLGHSSCISAATPMWTACPRAHQITNEACDL